MKDNHNENTTVLKWLSLGYLRMFLDLNPIRRLVTAYRPLELRPLLVPLE
jgi:hypothetical protein